MERQDDSERAAERAVCENRNAFHWAVAENADERRYKDESIFYTMAKGAGPIRLVSQVRLDLQDPDGAFAALVAKIRSGELPQNVAADLLCAPDDLGGRLEKAGAIPREQTLMSLELKDSTSGQSPGEKREHGSCSIVRVDSASMRQWAALPTRWLWNGDEAMLERNVRLYEQSIKDPRFAFFGLKTGAGLVSSALLFGDPRAGNGAGTVAGVYAVATPENERGKGYGGLVTLACVEEARKRGFASVVLYATALGKPVYERLGFRTVGKAVSWRFET